MSATLRERERAASGTRLAYLDNLKVTLVTGVIAGHAFVAWTGFGSWYVYEPPLREPYLTLVVFPAFIGVLFAMGLFFLVAGLFTPGSLARKGTWRFLKDRALRLGVPMVAFVLLVSPFVEYVDPDNADFPGGFWAFVPAVWWPPAPGPTWFLGVLLLFSTVYALAARMAPASGRAAPPLRTRYLVLAAGVVAVTSYVARIAVPLGEEWAHLAIGQAASWMVMFTLGVVGATYGWFDPVPRTVVRGWRFAAAIAAAVVVGLALLSGDPEVAAGGGTWQSLVLAAGEGVIVVGVSLMLLDLFRRRYDHQGPVLRAMSRAAYTAFLVHPPVLVGLIVALRPVDLPTEVKFLIVAPLAVAASYGLAALLVRVPGVSRVV
jgi:hypothetical protein